MNEEWLYLVKKYNEAGARSKFENICASLFKKKFLGEHVKEVKASGGDGGIDIFIGGIGKTPIHVIQCKFFINGINDSQKKQIRDSFTTVINSTGYKCSRWSLCIPGKLTIREHLWWSNWKTKQQENSEGPDDFIQLIDGSDLIDDLKLFHLYDEMFDEELKIQIKAIYERIYPTFHLDDELANSSADLNSLKDYFSNIHETHLHRQEVDNISQWVSTVILPKYWTTA